MFVIVCMCQVDAAASPAVVKALKPKVYLTCALSVPSQAWCNLSQ